MAPSSGTVPKKASMPEDCKGRHVRDVPKPAFAIYTAALLVSHHGTSTSRSPSLRPGPPEGYGFHRNPRDPSIQVIPTLGPKVCKYDLRSAMTVLHDGSTWVPPWDCTIKDYTRLPKTLMSTLKGPLAVLILTAGYTVKQPEGCRV